MSTEVSQRGGGMLCDASVMALWDSVLSVVPIEILNHPGVVNCERAIRSLQFNRC